LVAPAGSNWQHHPEILRNGQKFSRRGFDFGLEVGPSNCGWLELIDSIDDRALRCARSENLLDTKSQKNGRVCPTNYEQPQHHDYNDFTSLSIEGISSRAAEFYASGLSLAQISRQLNKSRTFIRKTLLEAGVSLRESLASQPSESSAPPTSHSGNTPFGYRNLRGRLIMDAREIEIVHSIM
jgi:hypothetical protein